MEIDLEILFDNGKYNISVSLEISPNLDVPHDYNIVDSEEFTYAEIEQIESYLATPEGQRELNKKIEEFQNDLALTSIM